MSVSQAEVYEALRTLDVPDKALKAAIALSSALGKVEDEMTKGFSKRDADIDTIRKDVTAIKLDIVGIKGELVNMRWMGGVIIALVTTVLFRILTR